MKVSEKGTIHIAICIRRVDKADACSVVTAKILIFFSLKQSKREGRNCKITKLNRMVTVL